MEKKDARIINWLLIMQAWQQENKTSEFADAFGFNRNVYFNIQKGGEIDGRLLKRVGNKSGISFEILDGKELLKLEDMNETDFNTYLKLLKQRAPGRAKNKINKDVEMRINQFRDKTKPKVIGKIRDAKEGSEWYNIAWFCKNKTKFSGLTPELFINDLMMNLDKVTWDMIKDLNEDGLYNKYKQKIKEQYELLEAIGVYKKYKLN